MAEYNLDKRQDKLPYDVVCELSSKYKRDYDRLISAEKSKAKQMAKETRRIKRNKRFLSLRRLIFLMFVLLFLASSFLYAGFAVNRYIGYGIVGLTAISLAISAICFILAVFRAMYFKTAFMVTEIMLTVCAVAISTVILALFRITSYWIILFSLIIVFILNRAYATTRYSAKSQLIPALISFAAIALSILCLFGIIREKEIYPLHSREVYSRFEKYHVVKGIDTPEAWFEGVMLTIDDIVPIGDKKVYEVPASTPDGIKITSISANSFYDITSINTVVLPSSVTSIYTDAFRNSGIQTIEAFSTQYLYIADGFQGSSVQTVKLFNNKAISIVVGSDTPLADGVMFLVPAHLLKTYRLINPEIADRIIAI